MNADEATDVLPRILEANFEGRVRRVGTGVAPQGEQDAGGWLVEVDDAYGFCRIGRGGPGFVWVRLGVAHAIPKSSDLAYFIARANGDLMVGRAYLAAGEEIAMVVVEDTAFIPVLSWEHQETFADLGSRMVTAVEHATKLRRDILERFGGRPFGDEDWIHLVM